MSLPVVFTVATVQDFDAYYKHPAPGVFTALTARQADRIVAMAGVMWDDEGRAWGFMDHRFPADKPLPAFAMHRQALRFLDVMRQVGEPAIYTGIETHRSPRAEAWLKRLGFEITNDFSNADQVIWKWPLPSP